MNRFKLQSSVVASALAGIGCMCLAGRSANAATVTVSNASFETPSLGETSITANGTGSDQEIPDWYSGDTVGRQTVQVNSPPSSEFPTTTNGSGSTVLASPGDGLQIALVNIFNSAPGVNRAILRYVPNANGGTGAASLGTYQAGATYTLTYAAGFRGGDSQPLDDLSYTAAFTDGTGGSASTVPTTLATGTAVSQSAAFDGTFQNVTVSFTVAAGSSIVGDPIGIALQATPTNLNPNALYIQQALFDNVRVTATPVPEPASLGLVGIAGAGLVARRRRRLA